MKQNYIKKKQKNKKITIIKSSSSSLVEIHIINWNLTPSMLALSLWMLGDFKTFGKGRLGKEF